MCRGNRKRDITTMVTYSHATTPLGQSERAYYLSYFINRFGHTVNFSCNILLPYLFSCLQIPGGRGRHLTKFNTGRLCPEVQPLTLLYTIIVAEKGPLLYIFY